MHPGLLSLDKERIIILKNHEVTDEKQSHKILTSYRNAPKVYNSAMNAHT